MPHADDPTYYRHRADQSRMLAMRAATEEARAVHHRLARLYDQLSARCSARSLRVTTPQ